MKSITIIHSATTETVRLPNNNNEIIVHTAIRTKVPFKKKVRGQRSINKSTPKDQAPNVTTERSFKDIGAKASVQNNPLSSEVNISTSNAEKKLRSKKNKNINVGAPTSLENMQNIKNGKRSKKLGKQMKEIIDYSHRSNKSECTSHPTSNTIGKVQKWLLESPIASQPSSYVEHTSKVHKVISKSQSTPERLSHKSPQNPKSIGNISNEKVKLQVVYKPPFKFSLRLSKKSKIKTHVVNTGNVISKGKRVSRNSGRGQKSFPSSNQIGKDIKSLYTDRTKRSALLFCTENDEDNQILTLNDKNGETSKPGLEESKNNGKDNELGYNVRTNDTNAENVLTTVSSKDVNKMNIETKANQQPQANQTKNYKRSNSLSSNNPFAATLKRSSGKIKENNSINLNRNYSSTQNLINRSQSLKSKKRSSLNLKGHFLKYEKETPISSSQKRLTSSNNLRGENCGTSGTGFQEEQDIKPYSFFTKHSIQESKEKLPSTTICVAGPSKPNTHYRSIRNSMNNIPRASLTSSINANNSPPLVNNLGKNYIRQPYEVNNGVDLSQSLSASLHQQKVSSGSNHEHTHNTLLQPSTEGCTESELPSDLEVVVSDIENLVS